MKKVISNPKALGCSNLSTARALLQGLKVTLKTRVVPMLVWLTVKTTQCTECMIIRTTLCYDLLLTKCKQYAEIDSCIPLWARLAAAFSCIEAYFAVKLRYVNIELHINVPAFLTEAETLFSA